MSWSTSFKEPVSRDNAVEAIDALTAAQPPITGPVDEGWGELQQQLLAAKNAAKDLVGYVGGPTVSVSLGGHVNVDGNSAAPSIYVSVSGSNAPAGAGG